MLPIHKEVVERLFTSSLLKLLFTTETFALGINMPARTVVFDSLRKFDGVSFDYMSARDYMQMAGRAGRQGIDEEGLVISILDDEALVDAPLSDLFGGKVEPIQSRFNLSYSTIINLWERMHEDLLDAYRPVVRVVPGAEREPEEARSGTRARARRSPCPDRRAARGRVLRRGGGPTVTRAAGEADQRLRDPVHRAAPVRLPGRMRHARAGGDVHRHRPRTPPGPGKGAGPPGVASAVARRAENAVRRFMAIELQHGFRDTVKPIDFGLSAAVIAWSKGCQMRELERLAGADGGDVVRTLRMAIQMMRQMRSALSGDYGLIDRLAEAIVAVNRDEVDAKRQFELG